MGYVSPFFRHFPSLKNPWFSPAAGLRLARRSGLPARCRAAERAGSVRGCRQGPVQGRRGSGWGRLIYGYPLVI